MDISSYNFQYDPKNLDMFRLDVQNLDPDLLMISGIIFLTGIILYFLCPYIQGMFIVYAAEKKKTENRSRIQELIMMKEVQNELEKEIEESLLNVGLKSSTLS